MLREAVDINRLIKNDVAIKMKYFLYPCGIFALFVPGLSFALAAEPIQSDRPGFSTGTYTVAPGVAQLELGFQSDYGNNNGDPDTFTAPLINVRVGLTPVTELNILVDGWSREHTNGGSVISSSDMLLGAKHRLIMSEQYNVSLLGYVSLPTGNAPDAGSFTPFLGLLWDYELGRNVSAFGTLQFVSFVEGGQRSNNFQPAIGLSFSHSDTLSTYIEYYRDMSLNISDARDIDMFDAGVAYLLTDNVQLDVNFGVSIDRYSSDFFGAGIAIRF